MRKDGFRAYLQHAGYSQGGEKHLYTKNAINNRVSKCACVERDKPCNLDAEYMRDQLGDVLGSLPAGNIKNAVLHYRNFCSQEDISENELLSDENDLDEERDASEADVVFGLESQLRDFIAQNIEKIPFNGMKLKLHANGVEYATEAGFIDILAENEAGDLVIFELKRGRTPDHVIGQLSRYMGWAKENIGKEKSVYGVIVAKTIGQNLHYAKAVIPNVSLLEYEVSFNLKDAKRAEQQ